MLCVRLFLLICCRPSNKSSLRNTPRRMHGWLEDGHDNTLTLMIPDQGEEEDTSGRKFKERKERGKVTP